MPPEAPAAIERLARDRGGTVQRMESGAPTGCQRSLRDGLFAACQIVRYVQRTGETLSQLFQRLPGCLCARIAALSWALSRGSTRTPSG